MWEVEAFNNFQKDYNDAHFVKNLPPTQLLNTKHLSLPKEKFMKTYQKSSTQQFFGPLCLPCLVKKIHNKGHYI